MVCYSSVFSKLNLQPTQRSHYLCDPSPPGPARLLTEGDVTLAPAAFTTGGAAMEKELAVELLCREISASCLSMRSLNDATTLLTDALKKQLFLRPEKRLRT